MLRNVFIKALPRSPSADWPSGELLDIICQFLEEEGRGGLFQEGHRKMAAASPSPPQPALIIGSLAAGLPPSLSWGYSGRPRLAETEPQLSLPPSR